MTLQNTTLRRTLLAMAVSILATATANAAEDMPAAGSAAGAAEGPVAAPAEASADAASAAREAEELAMLQRNVHEMRLIVDGDRAQRKAVRRGNAGGLIIDSRDAPGIGTMRAELTQSLERLANRCFGNEIDAGGGNVILICGNNAGTAESSNVTNSSYTTVVVPPAPAAETADDEALPEPEAQP